MKCDENELLLIAIRNPVESWFNGTSRRKLILHNNNFIYHCFASICTKVHNFITFWRKRRTYFSVPKDVSHNAYSLRIQSASAGNVCSSEPFEHSRPARFAKAGNLFSFAEKYMIPAFSKEIIIYKLLQQTTTSRFKLNLEIFFFSKEIPINFNNGFVHTVFF